MILKISEGASMTLHALRGCAASLNYTCEIHLKTPSALIVVCQVESLGCTDAMFCNINRNDVLNKLKTIASRHPSYVGLGKSALSVMVSDMAQKIQGHPNARL